MQKGVNYNIHIRKVCFKRFDCLGQNTDKYTSFLVYMNKNVA